jgi:protein SCO1
MTNNSKASTQCLVREYALSKRFIALLKSSAIIIMGFVSLSIHAEVDKTSFYQNFESLSFKNQDSQNFKVSELNHKVVLFNFIYTQCSTVCSLQTKSLVEVINTLPNAIKPKVVLISVSLDPLNDTPKKLTAFAKKNQADINNWSFITGKPDDVVTLSDRLKLYGVDKKKSDLAARPNDHSTHLWLIDAKGRLIMRYMGSPVDKVRLVREISELASI